MQYFSNIKFYNGGDPTIIALKQPKYMNAGILTNLPVAPVAPVAPVVGPNGKLMSVAEYCQMIAEEAAKIAEETENWDRTKKPTGGKKGGKKGKKLLLQELNEVNAFNTAYT